jgi:hypothetical protein
VVFINGCYLYSIHISIKKEEHEEIFLRIPDPISLSPYPSATSNVLLARKISALRDCRLFKYEEHLPGGRGFRACLKLL